MKTAIRSTGIALLLLSACSSQPTVTLHGPGDKTLTYRVEIADDNESRMRGLMEREHLDDDAGMLFIFDEEEKLSFWMKNTRIPLDILFFDSDGKFVSGQSMQPCTEDPCPTYASEDKARYALEVNVGTLGEHAIASPEWTLELP